MPQKLVSLCTAIAREEGFFVPGSRAWRNNNPGNIDYGPFAIVNGATKIESIPVGYNEVARFAYFPDDQIGFNCMSVLLHDDYVGRTVKEAVARWAPPTENNDQSYLTNICTMTGLTPDTVLTDELVKVPEILGT